MVQKTLEICLSETLCLGKPRVCAKDFSPQAMLIPDAKATVDKELKRL